MKNELKKEMITAIDIMRENLKSNMEITLDGYTEVMSKLDMLTYLLLNDNQTV